MKIKTSELKDRALDYAVAVAEGYKPVICRNYTAAEEARGIRRYYISLGLDYKEGVTVDYYPRYSPSTGPAGDDIIDREKISTWTTGDGWHARDFVIYTMVVDGATRREAAMRAYVASKLGDEVEIPDELI